MVVVSPSFNKLSSLQLLLVCLFILFEKSDQFQLIFGVKRQSIFEYKHSIYTLKLAESSQESHQQNNGASSLNNQKGKKKKKIVINTNLTGVDNVSSDGILTERKEEQKEAQKFRDSVNSNLGLAQRRKMSSSQSEKKLSTKAKKIMDQRTANGSIDGTLQAGLALPEDQQLQVQEVKRGNKQVTIVRGFLCAMDERKSILKDLKKKIGGGGTCIEGIIELQGSHSELVVQHLKSKGYTQTVIR